MRVSLGLALVVPNLASYCHWDGDKQPQPHGDPNMYEINEYEKSSSLVATVANGKLFNVTVPHDGGATTSHFPVVHLYGDAEARGRALGSIIKNYWGEHYIDTLWDYFKSQITDALPGVVPKFLADLIAEVGLEAALDLTSAATKGYTNPEYYAEMQAMADASGYELKKIRGMNMIAGLTQGKCSMFGAWGDALAEKDGVLQLRALDWDMADVIVNSPLVTVYHTPASTYATVGVAGLVGALTGMSDKQMAISEIGVSFPDDTFGKESRLGTPFIFLLRDILHEDHTLDETIDRMKSAKRTCDLILGAGDGKAGAGEGKGFRSFQYSASTLNVIDDSNLLPVADWHQPIDNIVYHGMDWVCPGVSQTLHDQLKKNYGNLTAELAIRDVTAVEQSGDTHLAYYDLKNMNMYVSFARQSYLEGPVNGYDRQFTRLDLTSVFAEPAPGATLV